LLLGIVAIVSVSVGACSRADEEFGVFQKENATMDIKVSGMSQSIVALSGDGSMGFIANARNETRLLNMRTGGMAAVDSLGKIDKVQREENFPLLYRCLDKYIYLHPDFSKGLGILVVPTKRMFYLVYMEEERPFYFLDGQCHGLESDEVFTEYVRLAEIVPESSGPDTVTIKTRSYPSAEKATERFEQIPR
jgi:hypothetical protein